jgi:hypothetical protein
VAPNVHSAKTFCTRRASTPAMLLLAILTFLVVVVVALGVGGLVGAWYAWTRHPWERVYRESEVPARARTVELTRVGVTVGAVMVSAGATAGLLSNWPLLREWFGLPPTVLDAVGAALPGDLLANAAVLVGAVAVVVPFLLALWDLAAGAAGRRD